MASSKNTKEMKPKIETKGKTAPAVNNHSLVQHLLNYLNPFESYDEFPIFADWNRPLNGGLTGEMMKTNIKESGKEYKMEIEVPGVDKKDIKITLSDGYLTVKVNTSNEENTKGEGGNFLIKERFVGSYRRSWYVGRTLKHADIRAKTNDGVLTITFPKTTDKKDDKDEKMVTIS